MGAIGSIKKSNILSVNQNKHAQNDDSSYVTFSSNVVDSWSGMSFRDSDEEYINFMDDYTNVSEAILKLDRTQREDIRKYTRGYLMNGQHDIYIENSMDALIDNTTINKDIVIHRNADGYLLNQKSSIPNMNEIQRIISSGDIIQANSFLSGSAAKRGLDVNGHRASIDYEIRIPSGTGYASFLGNKDINGWGTQQREVVVSRYALLKPMAVKRSTSGSAYTVVLQVVGVKIH